MTDGSGFGGIAVSKRIVVKIGSSLLVQGRSGQLREDWLTSLVDDLAVLSRQGKEMLVVSSGAIALGRGILGMKGGKLALDDSQAAAAVGQIALSRAWSEALGRHEIRVAQILLTLNDTEERRRYLNARATISRLLALGALPVINENDSVATEEIRYGDNDRLAARVAVMLEADCLILLSDIDGLYTMPPARGEGERLDRVTDITAEIEAMASDAGSELSRGGMRTKVEAARMAMQAGCHMAIASGRDPFPLKTLSEGGPATWFVASTSPARARKAWIGGSLEIKGRLTLDQGAITALKKGRSLLPAGVTEVSGTFQRGDCVALDNHEGRCIARGLVAYDAGEARLIKGAQLSDIESLLGFPGRGVMIHRDDLAMI